MRHIWFGALTALIVISGCKSNETKAGATAAPSASAVAKKGALDVKWVGKRFSIEGERARGNFVVPTRPDDSGGLVVRSYLYDFPAGTKATFGSGKPEAVKEGKPLVQTADFSNKVAGLGLDDVQRKRIELDLPLTIDYPGRGQLKLKSPPLRIAHAIANDLTRAEKGPAKYPGEAGEASTLDTVAIIRVRSRSRRMRVLGTGKTVADIDWVALEQTHGEPRKVECPRAGKQPRVIKLTDLEVAVYDRLTGKAVETKVFPGKAQCTPPAKGAKAPPSQREEIDTWLRGKLGLPEPPPTAAKEIRGGIVPPMTGQRLTSPNGPEVREKPLGHGAPARPTPPPTSAATP